MLFDELSKYSIPMDLIHAKRGWTIRHRRSIEGGAAWVGRTVGAMDGAIEPPWMGLRRVLPTHTAPPNKQKTRAALAVAVAVDSAGAGRNPADTPAL
jgi:hypothetical protein